VAELPDRRTTKVRATDLSCDGTVV